MSELPEAPQTRIENYLGAIAGGEGELPEAPRIARWNSGKHRLPQWGSISISLKLKLRLKE